MKEKKFVRSIFVALAFMGSLVAQDAFAQTKAFVGGGLGFDTTANDSGQSAPGLDQKFTTGKSNFTGQIEGGVRFNSSGNVVFGVGLYVDPLTLKADEQGGGAGFTSKTEIKHLMGLFGEVGLRLAAATVAYGRLSYNQGKAEFKFDFPPRSGSASKNFTGMGLGVGVQHALVSNMYLFVDWHHVMGREVSMDAPSSIFAPGTTIKVKPTLTTGLVGVGWTFP